MADLQESEIRGLPVIMPSGRLLGTVHDTVIDTDGWTCTHIFVADPPADLVEGRIHVAVPWNWVRSIGDVVILRWFPRVKNTGSRTLPNTAKVWFWMSASNWSGSHWIGGTSVYGLWPGYNKWYYHWLKLRGHGRVYYYARVYNGGTGISVWRGPRWIYLTCSSSNYSGTNTVGVVNDEASGKGVDTGKERGKSSPQVK